MAQNVYIFRYVKFIFRNAIDRSGNFRLLGQGLVSDFEMSTCICIRRKNSLINIHELGESF